MAITATISQKELKRVAELAYEGETIKVMLCTVGTTGFNAQSTVADWQTVEASGNGYVRYSELIGVGTYNTSNGRYELPVIEADFTSTLVYSYDTIVVYINGSIYPHSIITENPNVVLNNGQTQTYKINLITDD